MKQQQIDEIILIAKFQQVQVRTHADGTISYRPDKYWECLMPVVEKIINANMSCCHCGSPDYYSADTNWRFSMLSDQTNQSEGEGETMIRATYNAVIEYVKWHNNNK